MIFLMTLVAAATFLVKQDVSSQDGQLWIDGSTANRELLNKHYKSDYIHKVDVDLSNKKWNPQTVRELRAFEHALKSLPQVREVRSLFSYKYVQNSKINEEQQMVEVLSLEDASDDDTYHFLKENRQGYKKYFDKNHVIFYIVSNGPSELKAIKTPLSYSVSNDFINKNFNQVIIFGIVMGVLSLLYFIIFRSLLPILLGGLFIYSDGMLTIAAYQLFSTVSIMHVSIALIAMTISVMSFTYIYYKWHVLQRKFDAQFVLYRVISKTIVPIFWTSVISVVGIGILIFVDSHILYSIGMNVLLSSIIGFILTFTMLPILLSFFTLKNPKIFSQKSASSFASMETRYNKKGLYFLLLISSGVMLYSLYGHFMKPLSMESHVSTYQIQAMLAKKGSDYEQIIQLQRIEQQLMAKFDTVNQVSSAYSMIRSIHEQENPKELFVLKREDVDSYLFMIDMYGLEETLMEKGRLKLLIDLKEGSDKTDVLEFLRDKDLIFQDSASLLNLAKIESLTLLWSVVFFVLLLIVAVTYYITRLVPIAFIALIVNVIPLIWFYAAIHFFDIPISSEVLVAMIITLSLSSDATLHFINYYHMNRSKPRSAQKAFEASFIYIGTPMGMGNFILAVTFASMIFVPVPMVSNIGLYSSILILLSLITDIFVLPVLFLNTIKT
ncbi:MAG: hypothetical protein Q7T91_10120, partial [Sulfuricurvum sp.]|nr:hypothetical protein [Sulfuricurvum sp.]